MQFKHDNPNFREKMQPLIVVSYQFHHPPISAKHSYWYCALQWNFCSVVKNKKLKSMENI